MIKLKSFSYILPIFSIAQFSFAANLPTDGMKDAVSIEHISKFVGDNTFTTNIIDLTEKAGLKKSLSTQPWSGTFWPLRTGSTANPYANSSGIFNRINFLTRQVKGPMANYRSWEKRSEKLREKILKNELDSDTIDNLSPAEKYDLFLGDYDFTFAHAEWESMKESFEFVQGMAFWEGSCHGWASAALYEERPKHLAHVISLDGKYLIPFYPDDLKALSTRLWANSGIQTMTKQVGTRCLTKNPERDSVTGKILDESCKGVNPGEMHTIVMEMVGARDKGFIVNRSNDTQIWNQPIAGYELSYYNINNDEDGSLNESIIPIYLYRDPFARYRPAGAKFIVGARMKIRYTSETVPTHAIKNEPKNDKIKNLNLKYDLVLDENKNILGGEWRNDDNDVVVNDDGRVVTQSEQSQGSDIYDDESKGIPNYPGFFWRFEIIGDEKPIAYSNGDFDTAFDANLRMVNQKDLIESSKKSAYNRVFSSFSKQVTKRQLDIYKDLYDVRGNRVVKIIRSFDEKGNIIVTTERNELRPQPLGKVVRLILKETI